MNDVWSWFTGNDGQEMDGEQIIDPSSLTASDCQRLFQDVWTGYREAYETDRTPMEAAGTSMLWPILYFFLAIVAAKIGTFLFEKYFEKPVEKQEEPKKDQDDKKALKDPIRDSLEMLKKIGRSSSSSSPEKQQEATEVIPDPIGDFSAGPAASQNALEDPLDLLDYLKKPDNPSSSDSPRPSLLQIPKRYPSRLFPAPTNLISVPSILQKKSSEILANSEDAQKKEKPPKSPRNFVKINRDRIKSLEQDRDPIWKGKKETSEPGTPGNLRSKSAKSTNSSLD